MSNVRTIDAVIADFGAGKISHDAYKALIENYNEAVANGWSKKELKEQAAIHEAQPELIAVDPILAPVEDFAND